MQAYCVKCKTKRDMNNPVATYSATGRAFTSGTCAVCGTRLTLFGATPAHASLPKPAVAAAAKPKATGGTKKKASTRKRSGKSSRSATSRGRQTSGSSRSSSAKARAPARSTAPRSVSRSAPKTQKLVIVESPAKARTVGTFLGAGYQVKASKGHVRDLLRSQLSVDVDNNFEPKYRVPNDKRGTVRELMEAASRAREIYLATDPDREGEAIAWHLIAATEVNDTPIRRVEFHEITPKAIDEAFSNPREIDMNLVNAQQARRILDRLVGYNITELLWEKIRGGRYRLSAGRVQSVAVRLIVDREREIEAFVPKEYWTLDARLQKDQARSTSEARPFVARLVRIGGQDIDLTTAEQVRPHLDALQTAQFRVSEVTRGERQRKPSPPFTTSTLQQEASRRLGFNASRTMAVAQQLYEGVALGSGESVGLITYMRTDSLNVSAEAQSEARAFVSRKHGKEYLPAKAPVYRTRSKGAQEAHEAIRPTSVQRTPAELKATLTSDQFKLYNLIWQRFLASQMANAIYNTLRIDIEATPRNSAKPYGLRVSGSTIRFQGFLVLYEDARDEDQALDEDEGRILPDMAAGDALNLIELLPEQHFTQPPPRYTEASLVRTLEEYGIGRPSTYAPTVAVIQDREYVVKKDKRLVPTDTGRLVNDLLVKSFPEIIDFQFTARMEDELDSIAEGELEWQPMLADFYGPFSRELALARQTIPSISQDEVIERPCPTCGKPLMIKHGRFGKFIGCSDYPNCRFTEPLVDKLDIPCPVCGKEKGGEIVIKRTRRGKEFFGCNRYPDCTYTSWQKPLQEPCPHCGGLLVQVGRSTAKCTICGKTTRVGISEPATETA